MRRRREHLLFLLGLLLLSSCTRGPTQSAATTQPIKTPVSSSPETTRPAPPASIAWGAPLVASLPDGCAEGLPSGANTIAFVARGRAWAVAPDGTGLTCMFELTDPGPFAWGPRGDRVVVGGLAVRGVGSGASRPAVDLAPTYLSWGRPVGKAIVFADGPHLQKALIGSGQIDDITPFQEVTYRDVVYHPSGLAIAFVLDGAEGSSIWIASNTGTDAKRLVWSKSGTVFGSLAFDEGGDQLFYVAHQPTGKWFVSRLLLKEGTVEEGQWIGDRQVLKLELAAPIGLPEALTTVPPHGAALNVGTTCSDQQAVSSALDHSEGTPLLPGASAPTSAIGWLDPSRILVAEGGCDGPYDLWVTGPSGSSPVLLAEGVVQASVRVSAPAEPPPLPDLGINTEFA